MPIWCFEFEGRSKPLDRIQNPDLTTAIESVRAHIAQAHASDPEFEHLTAVFFVDSDEGLKFTLGGPSTAVNLAIDRIGTTADVTSRIS